MFFKSSLIWAGMLLSLASYGQRSIAPLGALPMQNNSSFAGEGSGPRISSNIGFNSDYINFSQKRLITDVSYDQFVSGIHTGVGISTSYYNENNGGGKASMYTIGAAIAPKFSIKGKVTISPSLDFSFSRGDVYLDFRRYDGTELEYTYDYFRSRVGILVNTQKWYVGYSVDLYTNYKYSDDTIEARIGTPFKGFNSVLQLGYTFQRSTDAKFSFTPQIAFKIREQPQRFEDSLWERIKQVDFNFTFRHDKFIWGANGNGIHVGLQTQQIRVMLTNWIKDDNTYPYAGNLSFRYTFKKDK
jgi:hypothetical protein